MISLTLLPMQDGFSYIRYYKVVVDNKIELSNFYSTLIKYALWRPDKNYWTIPETELFRFPQFIIQE